MIQRARNCWSYVTLFDRARIDAPSSPYLLFPHPRNKGLSDTQNWPKEKRVKKRCDWKENECVRPASGAVRDGNGRSREERTRERRGAATRKQGSRRDGLFCWQGRTQRGKENERERKEGLQDIVTVRGRIYRSTSHCNRYNGHGRGLELPTRDPSDEGELYMMQNTIVPLSFSLSLSISYARARARTSSHNPFLPPRGPFPKTAPTRHPPTARTNADTRIPPDAHCRSACRSSFTSYAASVFDFSRKIRDRETSRRMWLWLCLL